MKKTIVLLFVLLTTNAFAQNNLELFPDDLTVQPFTANILEPKLGFLFQLGKNELRLDIGNSIDILRYKNCCDETFSFGADLFTYTLLRGESDFHFPVDAVDYLFGINFGYKKELDSENEYGARLRISHISAHFVDGHYDGNAQQWRDNLNPHVYSREFAEFIPYYKINSLRAYVGFTYLFHVTPSSIKKDNYQVGFDYFFEDLISQNLTPFVAYDYKLIHLDNYSDNHSVSAGIKFGKPNGKGLSLSLNYFSGKNIHGEYFDYNEEYTALSINLDL
jgi:hypothetical protein